MSGFIQGEDRFQATLFPERLDDYVAEDSAVRVIDVFLDDLDLSGLGFRTQPNDTGRPAYHPSTMLKLFVYGYLNRVQSSRRLEIEAQRNVELMWLTGRLAPDFKTIADFRKDNGVAIRLVCREFVMLCKKLNLFANAFVAIDGSKFKAVNSRDRNFTRAKMKRRLMEVDASIERYLGKLAAADEAEPAEDKSRTLEDKIAAMRKEMARLKKLEARMLNAPDKQISLTDPDARSMKTRGTGIVGYNVQTAVDTEHHLIVAHEVTNKGSDRRQLANMAKQAKSVIDTEELTAVADRGYYRGEDILDCDKANIETYLPKPQTSGNQAKGQFGRDSFRYIAKDNEYECPAGLRLVQHSTTQDKGRTLHNYWTYKCRYCDIKAQCTSGVHRKMSRWEHEEVLDAAQKRLDQNPDMMRIRRTTVEHPFGTLKAWMGSTHFMTKTLDRVSTEMSLHVLAYNMKRMMNIIGTKPLIEAIRA
jgi:transposase